MTDTITESFCERCGTRYAFEQNAERRRGGIGRVRVLTRGLKNYVANDGMPMSEAMAAAQHDEARTGVSRQLDAFHRTFNFCMSCRQYTCASCWNEKVGECLSCAPDLSREVLPAPFPDLPLGGPLVGAGLAPDDRAEEPGAWPTADLDRAPVVGAEAVGAEAVGAEAVGAEAVGAVAAFPTDGGRPEEPAAAVPLAITSAVPSGAGEDVLTATELEEIEMALAAGHPVSAAPAAAPTPETVEPAAAPVSEPMLQPVAAQPAEVAAAAAAEPGTGPEPLSVAAEPAAEQQAAVAAEPAAEQQAAVAAEPAAEQQAAADPGERVTAAQQQTRSLLRRFRPARPPVGAGSTAATPLAAAAIQQDGTAPAIVEPVATPVAVDLTAEPVPEPAAQPGPGATPEAASVDGPVSTGQATNALAPADTIEQPTWRIVAPETSPTPGATWPDAPAWPTPEPGATPPGLVPGSAAAPWASRLATARPEPTSVWAASSEEVLAAPGPAAASGSGVPAVQACVSCGLSLSANARFCRRCGSRQG